MKEHMFHQQSDHPSGFSAIHFLDVSLEYAARRGHGTFSCVNERDRKAHPYEVMIGLWLSSTFGGDVILLPQQGKQGENNPDFEWNGLYWELKSPIANSFNAMDQEIRKALRQIDKKPGGIILDLTKNSASLDDAEFAIQYRMNRRRIGSCDVLILKKNHEYKVLRFQAK